MAHEVKKVKNEKVDRQRPMMRLFIKGQDRVFPQQLL